MKSIYYKSKNNKYPGCSIDEIKADEFKAGFEFKTIEENCYYSLIPTGGESSKATITLTKIANGEKKILGFELIKDKTTKGFRITFKKLLDKYGIGLRDNSTKSIEEQDFDFGGCNINTGELDKEQFNVTLPDQSELLLQRVPGTLLANLFHYRHEDFKGFLGDITEYEELKDFTTDILDLIIDYEELEKLSEAQELTLSAEDGDVIIKFI